jgi:hypothetical protein
MRINLMTVAKIKNNVQTIVIFSKKSMDSIRLDCKSDRTTLTAFYRLTTFLKAIFPSANCTFTKYIPEGKPLKSSSKSGFEGKISCKTLPIKPMIWQ